MTRFLNFLSSLAALTLLFGQTDAGSSEGLLFTRSQLPALQPHQVYVGLTAHQTYFTSLADPTQIKLCTRVQQSVRCSPSPAPFLSLYPTLQYLPGETVATPGSVRGTPQLIAFDQQMRPIKHWPMGIVIGEASYSYTPFQKGVTQVRGSMKTLIPLVGLSGMPSDSVLRVAAYKGQPTVVTAGGWVLTPQGAVGLTNESIKGVDVTPNGFVLAGRDRLFVHRGPLKREAVRRLQTPGLINFCATRDYVAYFTSSELLVVRKADLQVQVLKRGAIRSVACQPEGNSFIANESDGRAARYDANVP